MNLARFPRPRRWALATSAVVLASLVAGGAAMGAGSNNSGPLEMHTLAQPARFLSNRLVGPAKYVDVVVPGIPADTKAVTINVSIANGTRISNLKIYDATTKAPVTSVLTWTWAAPTVSSVTVPITSQHRLRVLNARGSVYVTIDLQGYYTPATAGGTEGPMGPQGPSGGDGPMGPPGRDGTSAGAAGSVYVYAVNSSSQTIHRGVGNAITFDTKGATMGDVAFTSGTGAFTVGTSGVYKVTFWAIADEDNQFDLRVDGQVPAMGLVVFGGFAHQATSGTAVLTLDAGDVVTLQNISSTGEPADAPILAGDVILSTQVGGSAASINAWITIEQLNAPTAG